MQGLGRLSADIRSSRAQLKRELAGGEASIIAVLSDPPPFMRTARLRDALLAVPGIGEPGMIYVCRRARVDSAERINDLTEGQVQRIIAGLRRPIPGPVKVRVS